MIKQKEILKKYLLYFLVGIVICLVGVSGVFADTLTETFTSFNTTAESLSSQIQCNNEICVVYGVTQYNYQMDFEWGSVSTKTCSNSATITGRLSLNKTSMGINNNDFLWNNVYIVNNNTRSNCNWQVGFSDTTFTCVIDTLYPNFKIGYTLSTMGGQYTYDSIIYRSFDISCDTSTSQIIENNNTNTQSIINNNNQNTQDIINNNNQNTQDLIDSNKVCTLIDKNSIKTDNKYLNSNGIETDGSLFGVTDYIPITGGTIENLELYEQNWQIYSCFYNINKEKTSCFLNQRMTDTIPDDASYIRLSINKQLNKPQFKLCKNGSQATNDALNNLDDTLKDDNVDDNNIASSFEDFNDFLDDNSTITQLLTLPITLYTAILNNLNGSCSPFNLGSLYGENLILPCINVSQYLGSTLWNMIDIIISGFAIFAISKKMIKVFNNFSSLREGDVIDD